MLNDQQHIGNILYKMGLSQENIHLILTIIEQQREEAYQQGRQDEADIWMYGIQGEGK